MAGRSCGSTKRPGYDASLAVLHPKHSSASPLILAPETLRRYLGAVPEAFLMVQELSERSWRGDPPAPLESLQGTGEDLLVRLCADIFCSILASLLPRFAYSLKLCPVLQLEMRLTYIVQKINNLLCRV